MPIKLPQVGADSEPLSGCLTRGLVAFHKRITCKIGVHHIEHPICENGIVRYEMGVGKDNYRLIESQLEFEDDWTNSYENDQVKGIYGHIHFMMYGSGQNLNEPNRFFCHIIGNTELHLVPAEGNMYIMDPTMYYIRVNK